MSHKRIFQTLNIVVAVGALSACGLFKKDATAVSETVGLQGNYQTPVKKELSIRVGGIGCLVHLMNVSVTSMTLTQTAYADSDCAGKALGTLVTEGTFAIGPDLAVAPGAKALDYKISRVIVTPLDASWATLFGASVSGQCKVDEIPVGQSREVTGLDCGVLGRFPAKGQVYFTAYQMDGSNVNFTKLPHESLNNVGSEAAPATRNQELVIKYMKK